MNLKLTTIAALSMLTFSTTSQANDWGVGVLVGQSTFDGIEEVCFSSCDTDDSDTSIGVNLTYGFTEVWGVEAGYIDFGSATVDTSLGSLINISADVDASAIYLAGTGTLNFSEAWSGTVRLGVASLDVDANAFSGPFSASESGSSEELFAGASIDYNFNNAFSLGLRLDVIEDASSIALGLNYTFGN